MCFYLYLNTELIKKVNRRLDITVLLLSLLINMPFSMEMYNVAPRTLRIKGLPDDFVSEELNDIASHYGIVEKYFLSE